MRHFCTYFDINYLPRALVLYSSLHQAGVDFRLWALCLDAASFEAVERLALTGLVAVGLDELEEHDAELAAVKADRSRVEYYFTLTPSLPLYLLEREPGIDAISYLDADLRFYSSPEPVLAELSRGSVLIIPHGFPESLRHLEPYGKYNVGMVSFRNDADGVACLERWRGQCLEWCYDRLEGGRYADQAYLDAWPDTQAGVVVVDRAGVGLGPWNFMRYRIDTTGPVITVDGEPLVFYHFHRFKSVGPRVFDDGLREYGRMPRAARALLYGGYVRDLRAARDLLGRADQPVARSGRTPAMTWRNLARLAGSRRLLYDLGGRVLG
jgi:hypothetical protein